MDGWDQAKSLDGAALEARTAAVATELAARGIQPGDRVLWCARTSLGSVVSLLGVMRAGAVLVPLSPSARGPEVAHIVGDAQPAAAVCDHEREPFGPGVTELRVTDLADPADPADGPLTAIRREWHGPACRGWCPKATR